MAAPETVFRPVPLISGRGDVISAPFPWNFTGEDNLRIVLYNSVVGAQARIQGRFLERAALFPGAFDRTFTPTADRLASTADMAMGVGSLLDCSVNVVAGNPLIGQTYCMVQIIRGLSGATRVLGVLLAGYITAQQSVGYPGSPILSSIESGGVIRAISGTAPAPGGEIIETVPTGARWQLLTFYGTLTTSATVANRVPRLQHATGATTIAVFPNLILETASLTWFNQWASGLNVQNLAGLQQTIAPLPNELILLAGQSLRTDTANLQAGDQWLAPQYVVREWIEAN